MSPIVFTRLVNGDTLTLGYVRMEPEAASQRPEMDGNIVGASFHTLEWTETVIE